MPIIKSAKKRVRQAKKRHASNLIFKNEVRSAIREAQSQITSKAKDASKSLQAAQSAIDTAVKKNLLHKNTAARKKASLVAKAKASGIKVEKVTKTKTATKAKAKTTSAKNASKKAPAKKKSTTKKSTTKK